jgi:hypothetical protein
MAHKVVPYDTLRARIVSMNNFFRLINNKQKEKPHNMRLEHKYNEMKSVIEHQMGVTATACAPPISLEFALLKQSG